MASPKRLLVSLSFFCVYWCIAWVAYLLLEVPRAKLPQREISELLEAVGRGVPWSKAKIRVSSFVGVDSSATTTFTRSLGAVLGDEAEVVSGTSQSSAWEALHVCNSGSLSKDCTQALESLPTSTKDETIFELFIATPSKGDSCQAELQLGAGFAAILRLCIEHRDIQALSIDAGRILRQTWLRKMHFENKATLFEIAPSYTFSFFLVGDCERRVSWDFVGDLVTPYLQPLFEQLGLLFDIEVDSQVVQCGSLGDENQSGGLNVEALQNGFLRHANEWPGDTLTREARWMPPLLNFVAYRPSKKLSVFDEDSQTQGSFAVPGWGAVVLTGAAGVPGKNCAAGEQLEVFGRSRIIDVDVDSLSACEAQRVASAWAAHLRAWLQLPFGPTNEDASRNALIVTSFLPQQGGIAAWELLVVSRAVGTLFVQRAAESLENLLGLINSLPDVVVRAEIAHMTIEVVAQAQAAFAAAERDDVVAALVAARQALALALTALHDDTVMAHLHFSIEYKYAIYLPIALPVFVPIMQSALRELKAIRQKRL